MRLCYVDESGTSQTLTRADADQQPVVVIAGVSLPEQRLTAITHEWIELKRLYLPAIRRGSRSGWLDGILEEVKGTTLRRGFRASATVRQRKQAVGLLDGLVGLLERHGCRILGRVWVKQLDAPIDGMSVHVPDLLAHSVFTQRFARTPSHERLVDMPLFGHSDNHAGLQITDLLCSALLAPVACAVYASGCAGWNRHCDAGFLDIRERYGERLARLTYHWRNTRLGRASTSLVVDDPNARRPTRLMWKASSPPE